jgi:hypothetical protein
VDAASAMQRPATEAAGSAGDTGAATDAAMPPIEVRPATHDRFDDAATVIGPRRPDASVCWCLSHRVDAKTTASPRRPTRWPAGSRAC